MKISYPRLRCVNLKAGASLRVIHGGAPEMISSFQHAAEKTIGYGADMAGYVIISWDFRGRAIRSWHIHERSPIQRSLLPAYARDILLKEITEVQTLESLEEIDE